MSLALYEAWITSTVAIALLCFLGYCAFSALAAWGERRHKAKMEREMEAEARRFGFKDLRGTRGRE